MSNSTGRAQTSTPSTQSPAADKLIGSIKSVTQSAGGGTIVIAADSGAETTVTVSASTKLLQLKAGSTKLADAETVSFDNLQSGDRVLVRGAAAAPDTKTMAATAVVVMKHSDVQARQQQDQEQWKTEGTAGTVKSVDSAASALEVVVTSGHGSQLIHVTVAKETQFRRYGANSPKFADAHASTLAEVQAGDQIHLLGKKNEDGTEIAAREVVTGAFRNLSGKVVSVDASAGSLQIMDLMTKKPVTVRVTADSQLLQLPPEAAQSLAARMKANASGGEKGGGAGASSGNANGAPPAGTSPDRSRMPASAASNVGPGGGPSGGGPGHAPGGGRDLQQILSEAPALQLSTLKKGDAVMIVSTEGDANGVTAVKLLSGVELLLTASPSGSQSILSAWSIGSQGPDTGGS